jgi:DNA invertase Pin-like site-specific DNA recombinase
VSHKGQYDRGTSIADQEQRIRAYIAMRAIDKTFGNAEWDKLYVEPRAQSAYSRPLFNRPVGKQLWEDLQPGDHIVADKLDRMFRSMHDYCSCEKFFAERGIRLHFVNFHGMSLDTGTSGGDLMIKFFALMAESESSRIGERVSLARASLRSASKHQGTTVPFFCSLHGSGTKKRGGGGRMVLKEWAIPMMETIVTAKDAGIGFHRQGMSGVYEKLRSLGVVITRARCDNIKKVRQLYWFYKAWVDAGRPDVNTLKIGEFSKNYQLKIKGLKPDGSSNL